MRLLREHDEQIESQAGYACMKCIAKDTTEQTIARAYKDIFTNYAWPGGYTVMFIDDSGNVYCADCAKRAFITEKIDFSCGSFDEGPSEYCCDCNREIESSYGDPEAD